MNAERIIALLRDIGCIGVGLGGMVYQLAFSTQGPDAAVMAVLAGIASIPLATNLRALRPNSGGSGTRESLPQSPGQSESPDSSQQSSSPT